MQKTGIFRVLFLKYVTESLYRYPFSTPLVVERIIQMVTDEEHPVDIDRLLVMTFTNAAAAEMRERIGEALEKRLEDLVPCLIFT